jgi:hypothetical protein
MIIHKSHVQYQDVERSLEKYSDADETRPHYIANDTDTSQHMLDNHGKRLFVTSMRILKRSLSSIREATFVYIYFLHTLCGRDWQSALRLLVKLHREIQKIRFLLRRLSRSSILIYLSIYRMKSDLYTILICRSFYTQIKFVLH